MIQKGTILEVADNSGAKKVNCFCILGGSRKRVAKVGDVIVCSVREAIPTSLVKKKAVVKGLVVRTRFSKARSDGVMVNFSENAVVLIKEVKGGYDPVGTRVFGPVSRALREAVGGGWTKIISLAPEVI